MGLCVGDALGVPVEALTRAELEQRPVRNMRSFGTYNLPAGTWSDDTSMTLCLVESLCKGLDYKDIMDNFFKWLTTGAFTPYGEAFGVGGATRRALARYTSGVSPLECGGRTEKDNGNGSLMRILPIIFYLQAVYGLHNMINAEAMNIIHEVSSLTHAHPRSLIACGIYISIAAQILEKKELAVAIETGVREATEFYQNHGDFRAELSHYQRILDLGAFARTPVENIKSSGYVVFTLEAAIWCLLNTKNYKDCVLKAVNLGEDSDTVAAVAGGLAGLYYGYEQIPKEWLAAVAKRDYIEQLCQEFAKALSKNSL